MENLVITVLVNGVGMASDLQVVGLGDLWATQFDPARAFALSRGRQLYISRGVGTVMYPVRFNVGPEVTVFTLRSFAEPGALASG